MQMRAFNFFIMVWAISLLRTWNQLHSVSSMHWSNLRGDHPKWPLWHKFYACYILIICIKFWFIFLILHLLLTKKVRLNSKLFILMIICWPWFGLMWTVYVIQVRFVPVMGHFDTDSSGVELFHPHKGHGTTNLLFGLLCSPDTGSGMCISINNN